MTHHRLLPSPTYPEVVMAELAMPITKSSTEGLHLRPALTCPIISLLPTCKKKKARNPRPNLQDAGEHPPSPAITSSEEVPVSSDGPLSIIPVPSTSKKKKSKNPRGDPVEHSRPTITTSEGLLLTSDSVNLHRALPYSIISFFSLKKKKKVRNRGNNLEVVVVHPRPTTTSSEGVHLEPALPLPILSLPSTDNTEKAQNSRGKPEVVAESSRPTALSPEGLLITSDAVNLQPTLRCSIISLLSINKKKARNLGGNPEVVVMHQGPTTTSPEGLPVSSEGVHLQPALPISIISPPPTKREKKVKNPRGNPEVDAEHLRPTTTSSEGLHISFEGLDLQPTLSCPIFSLLSRNKKKKARSTRGNPKIVDEHPRLAITHSEGLPVSSEGLPVPSEGVHLQPALPLSISSRPPANTETQNLRVNLEVIDDLPRPASTYSEVHHPPPALSRPFNCMLFPKKKKTRKQDANTEAIVKLPRPTTASTEDHPGSNLSFGSNLPDSSEDPHLQPVLPRPIFSLLPPKKKKKKKARKLTTGFCTFFSVFRSFPIFNIGCGQIPTVPLSIPKSRHHSLIGTLVTGTLFGYRNGRVSFALQDAPNYLPTLMVEFPIPTHVLFKEISSGMVRIALECDKRQENNDVERKKNKKKTKKRRGKKKGVDLMEEPLWMVFFNGKKNGCGMKREPNEDDLSVMEVLNAISTGVGVLPGRSDVEGPDGEVAYMRSGFEHVVGSKDSETLYILSPDGGTTGPDLSIFFVRV